MSRPFGRIGLLVLLSVAALASWEWQSAEVEETVLLEVENQSGRSLERIEISWSGMQQSWPGSETGQSALISILMPQSAVLTLVLHPSGRMVQCPIEPGQRLYVRVDRQGVSADILNDPVIRRDAVGRRNIHKGELSVESCSLSTQAGSTLRLPEEL